MNDEPEYDVSLKLNVTPDKVSITITVDRDTATDAFDAIFDPDFSDVAVPALQVAIAEKIKEARQ